MVQSNTRDQIVLQPLIHTTNRPRQSKFTMLFALNHIKETMYYWGDNYKMQTSHTLCSRPNGTVLCRLWAHVSNARHLTAHPTEGMLSRNDSLYKPAVGFSVRGCPHGQCRQGNINACHVRTHFRWGFQLHSARGTSAMV